MWTSQFTVRTLEKLPNKSQVPVDLVEDLELRLVIIGVMTFLTDYPLMIL